MLLETDRLFLRNAKETDADMHFEAWNSAFCLRYNAAAPPSREQAAAAVRRDSLSDRALYLELKETGESIGAVHFEEDSLRYRVDSLTLEYFLLERFAGQGYMTEALQSALIYAFEVLEAKVVSARAFEENLPSQRLLERLGFVREGLLRQAVTGYGDVVHNDVLFSLFPAELKK